MWVWGDRVLTSDARLASFAKDRGVGTLFLYVSPTAAISLLSGKVDAAAAVEVLRKAGLRVLAVAGEPDWSEGQDVLPDHAALLVQLVTRTELFAGLHFDVEPQALPQWVDDRDRTMLAAGAANFYRQLRVAAPSVFIDAAINPIFAHVQIDARLSLLAAIAQSVDCLSIMAYRDSVTRAVTSAADSARQAMIAGRQWRMGVLVDDDPSESHTSWHGVSPARFVAAMGEMNSRIAKDFPYSNYSGLAFEGYDGLLEMGFR
jgi:hypothetical protein